MIKLSELIMCEKMAIYIVFTWLQSETDKNFSPFDVVIQFHKNTIASRSQKNLSQLCQQCFQKLLGFFASVS